MKLSVRSVFFLFIFTLLPFFLAHRVFAQAKTQTTSYQATYAAPVTDSNVPQNLHTLTQNVMIETMAALTCQIAGIDPVNPNQQCLGIDQKTGKIGFVQSGGGAIGVMGHMIAMLYTPPFRVSDYFQNLASNFGIAKKAYAQGPCEGNIAGTGICSLSPLLNLWTVFRNIVYLLFVVVFVVIGLAIMLRVKIDPRTVMTIQNQIPKIIIGILLVTFSFAIAGFLIDIMYTSIYLTGNVIAQTDPSIARTNIVQQVSRASSPFAGVNYAIEGPGYAALPFEASKEVGTFIKPLFDNTPGRVFTTIVGFVIGSQFTRATNLAASTASTIIKGIIWLFAGATAAATATETAGASEGLIRGISALLNIGTATAGGVVGWLFGKDIVGFVASFIAFLVISIAILWALFRLWFMLIQAYLFFIINVVFAPFWILVGLVPGMQLSFGNWLREIISDLAVFPITIVLFLMGRVFMDQFGGGGIGFAPPMVGNFADPQAYKALIGMGMILLTPSMLEKTKNAIKAPKVDLSPVYKALGVGSGSFTSIPGRAGQVGLMLGGMQNIPGLRNIVGMKERQSVAAKTAQTPGGGGE